MASMERPKRQVSVLTFNRGKGFVVRLEYDHFEEKQSVLINGVLMSSFLCHPGNLVIHTFHSSDSESQTTGYLSEYQIHFAVEEETMRICYNIARRNTGGDDTRLYCYAKNTDDWDEWPTVGSSVEEMSQRHNMERLRAIFGRPKEPTRELEQDDDEEATQNGSKENVVEESENGSS